MVSSPPAEGAAFSGEGPGRGATLFISDPSAEAERAAQALRGEGYHVLDVPLSLLFARVSAQRPALVILDVDAEGGMDVLARLREVPGGDAIEVIFLGERGRTFGGATEAISAGASGFFVRPIDIAALVRKVVTLVPQGIPQNIDAGSTPPPSIPSARMRSPSAPAPAMPGEDMPSGPLPDSIAPQIQRAAAAMDSAPLSSSDMPDLGSSSMPMPPSMAPASLLDANIDPGAWGLSPQQASTPNVGTQLSDELSRLLSSAEERVGSSLTVSSEPPSPEAEVDAVLPAELLEALDEPIGFEDDELEGSSAWSGRTPGRNGTGGGRGTAAGTHAGASPEPPPVAAAISAAGQTNARADSRPPSAWETPTPVPMRRPTPTPPSVAPVAPAAGSTPAPASADDQERETPRPPRGRSSYVPDPELPPPVSARAVDTGIGDDSSPRTGILLDRAARSDSSPPTAAFSSPLSLPRSDTRDTRDARDVRDDALSRLTPSPPTPPSPPADRVIPESVALTEGEALRLVARAVGERHSGTLCFDDGAGLRRVVLRDGDFVTAGSSVEEETLVSFLASRGELPRDVAKRLLGRLAPFGRHAGAALIAHGHLGQDRLWEVLRSHAEWILGRALSGRDGSCTYEAEPPGRLKAEPSVFGGSTGAEVLVEVVRRVVPPAAAVARLGGSRARLGDGPRIALLGECALPTRDAEAVERARGMTVGELLEQSRAPELAPVLLALSALGVLDVLAASAAASQVPPPEHDPLDEEALRARVRARLDLVEEGDYFAVLGVTTAATPYEIKRAYLELRRSFEPGRVLTAATADLTPAIGTILEVLDEAYEILRDPNRRERYRRAIQAPPG